MKINLSVNFITTLTYVRSSVSVSNKAKRQSWPFLLGTSSGKGKPQHLYALETLPDDIQIAWAKWDQAALDKAKARGANKGHLPDAVTVEMAQEALHYPIRIDYYLDKKKQWDGKSKGLCLTARRILLERFPDLIQSQVDNPPELPPNYKPIKNSEKRPSKVCPACDYGDYLDESEAQFCEHDGNKLISVCDQCKTPIMHPRANYCGKCGNALRKGYK